MEDDGIAGKVLSPIFLLTHVSLYGRHPQTFLQGDGDKHTLYSVELVEIAKLCLDDGGATVEQVW